MPVKRPKLVNDEIYHIVVRGVGNSLLFKHINDYYRGIFSLYEFNNANPVSIIKRRQQIQNIKKKFREHLSAKKRREQFSSKSFKMMVDKRNHLVEVLAFCFMPNHVHLLLKQIKNDGITKFMRKFGAGYATYFNKKYNRRGHLFQSRFRAVHIKNDEQLKTVFVYIHSNGISLVEPKWKERGIKNPKKVIKFLGDYKWSSYQDYIGKTNFPSVTERKFLLKVMGEKKGCKNFVENWIKYKKELKFWNKITLE